MKELGETIVRAIERAADEGRDVGGTQEAMACKVTHDRHVVVGEAEGRRFRRTAEPRPADRRGNGMHHIHVHSITGAQEAIGQPYTDLWNLIAARMEIERKLKMQKTQNRRYKNSTRTFPRKTREAKNEFQQRSIERRRSDEPRRVEWFAGFRPVKLAHHFQEDINVHPPL